MVRNKADIYSGEQAETELNSTTLEGASLASPFKSGDSKTSHELIAEKEKLLNFVGNWRYRGLQNKQAEDQLAVLTQNVIEAQTDYIKHQLQLGLDKSKKEDYTKYLADIGNINKDIVALSQQAAKALVDFSFEVDADSFETKHKQVKKFKKLLSDGIIDQSEFEEQEAKITGSHKYLRDYTKNMISQIVESHLLTFEHTIKLFDENKITSF